MKLLAQAYDEVDKQFVETGSTKTMIQRMFYVIAELVHQKFVHHLGLEQMRVTEPNLPTNLKMLSSHQLAYHSFFMEVAKFLKQLTSLRFYKLTSCYLAAYDYANRITVQIEIQRWAFL